jgi:hypothetical protein
MLSMSFTVRSVDVGFADALDWHLQPFGRDKPEQHAFPVDLFIQEEDQNVSPPPYSFFFATSFGMTHTFLPSVLEYALWRVNAGIQQRVRDFLLLHAGAVKRDQTVVLLPAKMDSGKSSTVLGLLEAGFSYLSDEFAALDPISGAAYPVPKTIHVDAGTLDLFPGLEDRLRDRDGMNAKLNQRFVRPVDVDASAGGAGPVGSIVFLGQEFDGPPRLVPVPAAKAVEEMAATSFNLFRYEDRGVVLLARIAKEAPAFRLEGGSPRERAAVLAERLP